ncbi:hypothetical protein SKAU_G00232740 [Synaphobranchus kaupii]|uniref:Uncharacterized protein n=1 Tax=Synaphobranchus kaupii TaxID=118154 RepID=A0A9Q1F600_SYNKA|nr:hypothetical protein SKAU_G00232740 [Synaphobranchus kaupii]
MKRFKSLRDVYGRIKRESVRRSGSAATVPTNKWPYFALMAFMDPYMKSSMLDSLPPFERAQARVCIEQVLLEAKEFPGGRSQEIEESGGRMLLNL